MRSTAARKSSVLKVVQAKAVAAPAQKKPAASGDDYDEEGVEDTVGLVANFETPEWVELLLAVLRISELRCWIEEERSERCKETFQNPHAEIFAVVTSMKFEILIAVFILLNSIIIGLEASLPDSDSTSAAFNGMEQFFVAFFFVEWCLRIRAFGTVWVFEMPNAADTFLVFGTGVFPKWILEPLGADAGSMRFLTVVRILRLGRIVRTVRLVPQFTELWLLIQGLMQSLRPLLWIGVIMTMILYIFGIAATEMIARQEIFEDDAQVQELFGDPARSMFSLFQLMTLDSWAHGIVLPVVGKDSSMVVFFLVFILLAIFIFWNLVTAVICDNAFSIAKEDAAQKAKGVELQKKQELKILANIFLEIDTDGSGELSAEEFFAGLANKKVKQVLALLDMKASDMEDIWNILDDGDGLLTIKEWTNGLRRMKGDAKAKDLVDVAKKLCNTGSYHTQLASEVNFFAGIVDGLQRDVHTIQSGTSDILGLFQEMYFRLHAHVEREEAADRLAAVKLAKQREQEELEASAIAEEQQRLSQLGGGVERATEPSAVDGGDEDGG